MDMDMHRYWVAETKRNETKQNKTKQKFQETTHAKIVALYPSKHPGEEEERKKKKKNG